MFVGGAGATSKAANIGKGVSTAGKGANVISTAGKSLTNYYPKNGGALGEWSSEFLMKGAKIDRIGSGSGKYFSPLGTPVEMRALPKGNTGMYNAFEVVKPFEVRSSIISPAFNQIGLGKQYMSPVSADVLLKRGIIKPISQ